MNTEQLIDEIKNDYRLQFNQDESPMTSLNRYSANRTKPRQVDNLNVYDDVEFNNQDEVLKMSLDRYSANRSKPRQVDNLNVYDDVEFNDLSVERGEDQNSHQINFKNN